MSTYKKINDYETNYLFFSYIKSLSIPEIDYFSIGIQDKLTKRSTSIMSNVEWNNEFQSNEYALHDPVRRAVLNTNRSFIPFDEIDYVDSYGAHIMEQRKKLCTNNGIVVVDRSKDLNFLITFGSGYSKFKPIEFVRIHYKDIMEIKKDMMAVLSKHSSTLATSV